MASNSAVLYASLPELSVPHFLAPAIVHAAQHTVGHLLIIILADFFDAGNPISPTANWNNVQELLTFVYVQATKVAQDTDRLLMQIDVLLQGPRDPLPESSIAPDVVFRVDGGTWVSTALSSIYSP